MLLLLIGFVVAVTAAVLVSRVRRVARSNARDHGWMSEQWLAEHRASHPR
jgi:hypothetical protein